MCAKLNAGSHKEFEAEFAKETKCIRQESVMIQNIRKSPDLGKYIHVRELEYVAEIELSTKGKPLIKIVQTFTEIDSAVH